MRALADAIVRAYLALAASEEWLAGDVHPYAVQPDDAEAGSLRRNGAG
jgi:hypothetical protein